MTILMTLPYKSRCSMARRGISVLCCSWANVAVPYQVAFVRRPSDARLTRLYLIDCFGRVGFRVELVLRFLFGGLGSKVHFGKGAAALAILAAGKAETRPGTRLSSNG